LRTICAAALAFAGADMSRVDLCDDPRRSPLLPRWFWRPLVSRLVSEGWTVETAHREAQRLKDCAEQLAVDDFCRLARAFPACGLSPGVQPRSPTDGAPTSLD
jgi:hypothetical protein